MLTSNLVLAVSALVGLVSAQAGSFTSCCNVTVNSVDSNLRLAWCRAQTNTCSQLCRNGQTSANKCESSDLTYSCVCLSGTTPNISDYAQTLPSLECDEWRKQCTDAHPNDLAGQTFCQSFVCGKRNATAEFVASGGSAASSSAGSASSSASATRTGSTTTGSAATGSSAASASPTQSRAAAVKVLTVGREYGTAGLAVGIMALFGLAL